MDVVSVENGDWKSGTDHSSNVFRRDYENAPLKKMCTTKLVSLGKVYIYIYICNRSLKLLKSLSPFHQSWQVQTFSCGLIAQMCHDFTASWKVCHGFQIH